MSAIKPWAKIVYGRPPARCQGGRKWDQSSGACMTLSDYQLRGGITATMNGLGDIQIPGIPFAIPGVSLPSTVAPAAPVAAQPFYKNPWIVSGAVVLALVILARRA